MVWRKGATIKSQMTFSLSYDVADRFRKIMEAENMPMSAMVEAWMREYIRVWDKKQETKSMKQCPTCSAWYSIVLSTCPGCKENELQKLWA